MKAKDLIRILQGLEPDATVLFEVGRYEEYRKLCAKAELAKGDCLTCFDVDKVEIFVNGGEDDGELCNIILDQCCFMDLNAAAKEYDEQIEKKQS